MRVTWEVDDGYAGKSRPQHTEVPDCYIEECETADEAIEVIEEYVQHDFEQRIVWYLDGDVRGDAEELIEKRKAEEEDF